MSFTRDQKLGGLFAASAYTLWGVAPLYFKQIDYIPATEILVHRIVWSFVLLLPLLLLLRQGKATLHILLQPKLLSILLLSAILLGGNWGLFIWAVNNNHMLDASLGYYINPLLNVLLGMFFLGERLRKLQWVAVGLALVGVIWQILSFGALPWIALTLAFSFAFYGLLRKKLAVDAIKGLFIESLLLLPVGMIYWWSITQSVTADLTQNSWDLNIYLMAAGFVTTVPLLCFIAGAKRLQLSTMGFFQYIGPTMMFCFGIWIYQEPLMAERLYTFALIWLALLFYSIDAWRNNRARAR